MNFSRSPFLETTRFDGRNVTAVLGPTNTGKTFLAIERMVAHSSGVIGLPLRLLAREVYQKVCDRVGPAAVSLITGEEKIKPPNARYSVCTVEAMPRVTDAAFVAIDEVQLAADLERGHVFTDRILHTRGREETLLLGSSTMRGVLERLLDGVQAVTRPRLSNLLYAGSKKITRLPRRTAVVAFSADEVYAIAELIRRQRGGAAVVLGALSPRTRNAQVELYQSGDVDFLVATDAIGMGLNLDVDHVAFAQDWKFDGFQYRQLTPAEFGQIAGRAGRHVRDGTFGATGKVDPLPDTLVEALESHSFQPVRVLQWRSRDFDFSSLETLTSSLEAVPSAESLSRALPSVDQRALQFLSGDAAVVSRATDRKSVELLWEACKLPDYRRIAPAQHAEIIASVYADLVERGHVAEDYMAEQVRRADRTEGDIDTLSQRIAEIRTWTYISHRPGWLADPTHWQENTRAIEDRLSDALHDRLTKRFVDRRTSVLMKRLRENAFMEAEIGGDGTVLVEGHHVGELQGFRFTPDTRNEGADAKAVRAAAQKALAGEYDKRGERFANAPNGDLAFGSDGLLRWLGAPIAALSAGEDALKPRVVLLADEQLSGPMRERVAARAERYVTYQVSTILKPLVDLKTAEGLEGAARGLAFRLCENHGLVQRREIAEEVRSLDQEARAALRRCGVRFGAYHIFIPALVKPAPANLLTQLWSIGNEGRDKPGASEVIQLLSSGRTSALVDSAFDPVFYALAGYRLLGRRAVRVDILERLADLIRPAISWKPGDGKRPEGGYKANHFIVTPAMMSILGATADDMEEILRGLGYRSQGVDALEVEATLARHDAEAAAGAAPPAASEDSGLAAADAAEAAPHASTDPAEAVSAEDGVDARTPAAADVTEPEAPARQEALAAATPDDGSEPSVVADHSDAAASREEAGPGEADAAVPREGEAPAAGDEGDAERQAEQALRPVATAADAHTADADEVKPEPRIIQVWRLQRSDHRGARGEGQSQRAGHRRKGRGDAAGGGSERADAPGSNAPENGRAERQRRFGEGGSKHKQRPDKQRANGAETGGGRRAEPAPHKPQRIDPDSPFAKLAALRDKLGK